MSEEKTIIEVNGVKLEVDLRQAKRIDTFKVGDSCKILKKGYSNYESHLGVIVGFDDFKNLPTIIVAYLEIEYSTANIKFAYINSESKDLELCGVNDWDHPFTKQDIVDKINLEIEKKEEELRQLNSKKKVFLEMFGKYFEKQKV